MNASYLQHQHRNVFAVCNKLLQTAKILLLITFEHIFIVARCLTLLQFDIKCEKIHYAGLNNMQYIYRITRSSTFLNTHWFLDKVHIAMISGLAMPYLSLMMKRWVHLPLRVVQSRCCALETRAYSSSGDKGTS